MPLVKRKVVELVPPPIASGSDDPDVFYLAQTGELFPDFESYSNRLTFYNQKIFQCELTGRINLTYFEALKSERKEAIALHKIFPEQLKAPVLRAVQFQITGRIDELVDLVYDRFKHRFFPERPSTLTSTATSTMRSSPTSSHRRRQPPLQPTATTPKRR